MVPEWLTKIQNESGATENLPLFADDEEDVLVAGYTCIKTLFGADIAYRQIKEDLLARYEDMKKSIFWTTENSFRLCGYRFLTVSA